MRVGLVGAGPIAEKTAIKTLRIMEISDGLLCKWDVYYPMD